MNPNIFSAILSGNAQAIIGVASAMILTYGATYLGTHLAQWFKNLITVFVKPKWHALNLGQLTEIGDRFLDKISTAFDNQLHLDAVVAQAVADGTITPEEWLKLTTAAWQDFQDNLGIHDWTDFGHLLVSSISSDGARSVSSGPNPKITLLAAVSQKFKSVAKKVAAERAHAILNVRYRTRGLAEVNRSYVPGPDGVWGRSPVDPRGPVTKSVTTITLQDALGNSSGPSSKI